MSLISERIQIEAAPESVFDAITQQDGLARWWTSDAKAEPTLGSVAEFGFYRRAIVTRFRIEELDRAKRIRWHCVGGPPEYLGSEVVFELEPASVGTTVRFEHSGLKGTADFVAHAGQSWRRVLASLKFYVETGNGMPISG